MIRKVYVVAGHGKNESGIYDPGAVGIEIERKLNVEACNLIYSGLRTDKIKIGVKDDITKKQKLLNILDDKKKNALNNDETLVVFVHFNSATYKEARGCEILHDGTFTDKAGILASRLCGIISDGLNTPNRGLKQRNLYVLRYLQGNKIFIEMCFVSNQKDVDSRHKNKRSVCKNISHEINAFVGVEFDLKDEIARCRDIIRNVEKMIILYKKNYLLSINKERQHVKAEKDREHIHRILEYLSELGIDESGFEVIFGDDLFLETKLIMQKT